MTPEGRSTADARPWWRRLARSRWLAATYLLLGVAELSFALVDHDGSHWLIGALWVLAGLLWLNRTPASLRGGVIVVPARAFGRRRIVVADVESFARPHPFAVATQPSVVLHSGERVLLRDVDDRLLDAWVAATGLPVVRDRKPT